MPSPDVGIVVAELVTAPLWACAWPALIVRLADTRTRSGSSWTTARDEHEAERISPRMHLAGRLRSHSNTIEDGLVSDPVGDHDFKGHVVLQVGRPHTVATFPRVEPDTNHT